jgi:hypothetical protein
MKSSPKFQTVFSVLQVTGGPGFGKTTAVVAINIYLLSKKPLHGLATANPAVGNFLKRTLKSTAGTKRLQRVYTEPHEVRWLEDVDASNLHTLPTLKTFPSNPLAIYRGSLAQTVLQIADVMHTNEDWLHDLRSQHSDIVAFLKTPVADRDYSVDAKRARIVLYRNIFTAILSMVDMVFCTTTASGEKFLKEYNKRVKCHVFDEATSTQEPEILIS